ncbi:MAG TPA: hypothetical protein ENH82_14650, partial [bacterium]|nr:hypothetical protein [bacterium]
MNKNVIVFLVLLLMIGATSVYGQVDTILAVQEVEAGVRFTKPDTGHIDSVEFKRNPIGSAKDGFNFTTFDTMGLTTEYPAFFKNNIRIQGQFKNQDDTSDAFSGIEFLNPRLRGQKPIFGVNQFLTSRSNISHGWYGLNITYNMRINPFINNVYALADTNYQNGWSNYDRTSVFGGTGISLAGGSNGYALRNEDKMTISFFSNVDDNSDGLYDNYAALAYFNFSRNHPGMVIRGKEAGGRAWGVPFPKKTLHVDGSIWNTDSIFTSALSLSFPQPAATDTTDTTIGLVTTDSDINNNIGTHAFDNNNNTFWNSDSTAFPHEIVYTFPTDCVRIVKLNMLRRQGYLKDWKLACSTDSVTWDTVGTFRQSNIDGWTSYDLTDSINMDSSYKHYMIHCVNNYGWYGSDGVNNWAKITEIELFPKVFQDTVILEYNPEIQALQVIINGDTLVIADTIIQNMKINNLATDTIGADQNSSIAIIDPIQIDSIGALNDSIHISSPINGTSFTGDSVRVPKAIINTIQSVDGTDINLQLNPGWSGGKVQLIKGAQTDTILTLNNDTLLIISKTRIESLYSSIIQIDSTIIVDLSAGAGMTSGSVSGVYSYVKANGNITGPSTTIIGGKFIADELTFNITRAIGAYGSIDATTGQIDRAYGVYGDIITGIGGQNISKGYGVFGTSPVGNSRVDTSL